MDKKMLFKFIEETLERDDNLLLITMSERDVSFVANFDREHLKDFILALAANLGAGGEETLH